MRPRHEASENLGLHPQGIPRDGASMRPRHEASENVAEAERERKRAEAASMRPRHEASENEWQCRDHCRSGGVGFNEAEARGLGKRAARAGRPHRPAASMRPRHEASENDPQRADREPGGRASMRPRHEASENSVTGLPVKALRLLQ